jgi:signal-transduction protein with cAMP-binding, CBS, and nucleotidyltransferase domain
MEADMFNLRRHEREAVTVRPNADVLEVADRMDAECIGSIVVVDDADAPIGIVTDRDLALRVVAAGRDPARTRVQDVMTEKPVVAQHGDSLPRVLELCREHGVRRIPVVRDGRVIGVASLDDMLFDLAVALFCVADGVQGELRETARVGRSRRRHEARAEAIEELRGQLAELAHDAREKLREQVAGLIGRPSGG